MISKFGVPAALWAKFCAEAAQPAQALLRADGKVKLEADSCMSSQWIILTQVLEVVLPYCRCLFDRQYLSGNVD